MSMKRLLAAIACSALALFGSIGALIAYPKPLFAHVMQGKVLDVYSDAPIDEVGGRAFIAGAEALLAKWPLALKHSRYTIFVTNTPWRQRLLFTYRYGVGGLVYCVFTCRNAFLSGADFPANRLIAPSGAIMPAPRTLVYYGAHEAVHMLTGEALGSLGFPLMPEWIREGVADYVALGGAPDFPALAEATAELKAWPPLSIINRFGVYPKYRLLVAHMVEREGWSLERLLHSQLSQHEAEQHLGTARAKAKSLP